MFTSWCIMDLYTFSIPSEAINQAVHEMLGKEIYEIVVLTKHQLQQVAYSQNMEVFLRLVSDRGVNKPYTKQE